MAISDAQVIDIARKLPCTCGTPAGAHHFAGCFLLTSFNVIRPIADAVVEVLQLAPRGPDAEPDPLQRLAEIVGGLGEDWRLKEHPEAERIGDMLEQLAARIRGGA